MIISRYEKYFMSVPCEKVSFDLAEEFLKNTCAQFENSIGISDFNMSFEHFEYWKNLHDERVNHEGRFLSRMHYLNIHNILKNWSIPFQCEKENKLIVTFLDRCIRAYNCLQNKNVKNDPRSGSSGANYQRNYRRKLKHPLFLQYTEMLNEKRLLNERIRITREELKELGLK
jgi:hypothetical protein